MRVSYTIALLLSVYLLPWWFTTVFAAFGMVAFERFAEGVIAGILLDVLFAPLHSSVWYAPYPIFHGTVFLILFVLLTPFRSRFSFVAYRS
jgi:hypothetical protein